jgi:hypothetical protein
MTFTNHIDQLLTLPSFANVFSESARTVIGTQIPPPPAEDGCIMAQAFARAMMQGHAHKKRLPMVMVVGCKELMRKKPKPTTTRKMKDLTIVEVQRAYVVLDRKPALLQDWITDEVWSALSGWQQFCLAQHTRHFKFPLGDDVTPYPKLAIFMPRRTESGDDLYGDFLREAWRRKLPHDAEGQERGVAKDVRDLRQIFTEEQLSSLWSKSSYHTIYHAVVQCNARLLVAFFQRRYPLENIRALLQSVILPGLADMMTSSFLKEIEYLCTEPKPRNRTCLPHSYPHHSKDRARAAYSQICSI